MEMRGGVEQRYRAFVTEAADSPCFAEWAAGVVSDPEVRSWISSLPEHKQQPNLVFAAARWHGAAAPGPYSGLRQVLMTEGDAVRATILARATQTNEVGRLATLVPVLAALSAEHGPLSLIEVGASAGLCLYPDRYDYDWPGVGSLRGSGGPVLTASVEGPMPAPARHPGIAWRGGCDLNPLDVEDEDAMGWLETLVWPEQEERRRRLRQAIELTRAQPPELVAGDLLDCLPELVSQASRHGRPVIFHTAVIAYLDDAGRDRFHREMMSRVGSGDCHWVSNEGPSVLGEVTATIPPGVRPSSGFVLAVDGQAVARTHPHGAAIDWFGPA